MIVVDIHIEKCREDAIIPSYANQGDSGMDVYAAEEVIVAPGGSELVPIGIKLAIPTGYEIQVRPRSGISLNTPLRVPNSPGTIDSGYRDELMIIVSNSSTGGENVYSLSEKGNKEGTYVISKGDRIAQIVLREVPVINWVETEDVESIGNNREGGFGSTGI